MMPAKIIRSIRFNSCCIRIATVKAKTCSCQFHVPFSALVIVCHNVTVSKPYVSSSIAEYDVGLSAIILIGFPYAGQSPDVA